MDHDVGIIFYVEKDDHHLVGAMFVQENQMNKADSWRFSFRLTKNGKSDFTSTINLCIDCFAPSFPVSFTRINPQTIISTAILG